MFRLVNRASNLASRQIIRHSVPSISLSYSSSQLTFSSQRTFAKKNDKKDVDPKSKNKAGKGNNVLEEGEEEPEFDPKEFTDRMNETVEECEEMLDDLVIGRPTPESLESILVDYEGQKTALENIAQVYFKPPTSLVVSLYEPHPNTETAAIEAITNAGLDLNPIVEQIHGMNAIVVPFPRPTKDLRDSMTKTAKAKGEEYKIRIRGIRKTWNDAIKKASLPNDEAKRAENACQLATDDAIKNITNLVAAKEKEFQ